MKHEVKKKVSYVDAVKMAMEFRYWKAADLSRASGVSRGVLSRFLGGDGISADNLFAVLLALDLFTLSPMKNRCPLPCDQATADLCHKLIAILSSKTVYADAIRTSILAYSKLVKSAPEKQGDVPFRLAVHNED